MPEEQHNLVLADSFSYLNKGDAGIILGMLIDLRERFNNPTFKIISETPKIDEERYPEVDAINSPFRDVYRASSIFTKGVKFGFNFVILIWGILYRFTAGRLPCPGRLSIVSIYSRADAVLIAGGDKYYQYDEGLINAIKRLPKTFEAILAITVGTKIIIYGHSAGPFDNRYYKRVIKYICDKSALVTAREPISRDYLADLSSDIKLTGDAAFLAPRASTQTVQSELAEYNINNSKPIAGITTRQWNFPDSDGNMTEYISGIKTTISKLRDNGYQIVLFPQVIGPYTDDRIVSRKIAGNTDGVTVLESDYDVSILKALIGCCDIFVGTRMHSNIFALSEGVPTVAIAYRHKTRGIMRMFNLEEYVVDIADVESNLPRKVEELMNEEQKLESHLKQELPKMRNKSRLNSRYVKQSLSQ